MTAVAAASRLSTTSVDRSLAATVPLRTTRAGRDRDTIITVAGHAASAANRAGPVGGGEDTPCISSADGPGHVCRLEQQSHEPLGVIVEPDGVAVAGELGDVAREHSDEERRRQGTHNTRRG